MIETRIKAMEFAVQCGVEPHQIVEQACAILSYLEGEKSRHQDSLGSAPHASKRNKS